MAIQLDGASGVITPGLEVTNEYLISNTFVVGADSTLYVDPVNGRVGIGTSSPVDRLEVGGAKAYGSPTYRENISLFGPADDYPSFYVYTYGGTFDYESGGFAGRRARGSLSSKTSTLSGDFLTYYAGNGWNTTLNSWSGGGILFVQSGSATSNGNPTDIRFDTNNGSNQFGTERMRIDSLGNVGIGTSSPVSILEARTTGVTLVTAHTNSFTTDGNGSGFGVYRSIGGRLSGYSWTITAANVDGGGGGDYQQDAITFNTRPTSAGASLVEAMRIDSSGNVGIGTTTPTDLFTVGGSLAYGSTFTGTKNISLIGPADQYPCIIANSFGGNLFYENSSVILFKTRGTMASKANTESGDILGGVQIAGWNASINDYSGVGIDGIQTGASTSTGNPVRLDFLTNDGTTGRFGRARFSIAGNGQLSAVIPGDTAGYPNLYPSFTARAWVNFNGTGTVAIRGSGNVSSITDLGVGSYRVNLTTAMPDINYACSSGSGGSNNSPDNGAYLSTAFPYTASAVNIFTWWYTSSGVVGVYAEDVDQTTVQIFR